MSNLELLPISKERNLKANHNITEDVTGLKLVVTNIKRTKSESKSQQTGKILQQSIRCYQYQKNEI